MSHYRTLNKGLKAILIIFISLFALCIAVYAAGLVLFSHYMMPNTILHAEDIEADVSWYQEEHLEEIAQYLAKKTMTVNIPDIPAKTIALDSEAGYKPDYVYLDDVVTRMVNEQDEWLIWPYSIFQIKEIEYEPVYKYNENMVSSLVRNWDLGAEALPEDAYIRLNEDEVIEIVDEEYGNTVDRDALYATLIEHIDNEDLTVAPEEIKYIQPEIKADDEELQSALAAYNAVTDREISVDVTGIEEKIRLGALIDMNELFYNYIISVRDDKLDDYVDYLAEMYNTYETQRDFKTHDGRKIKVGGNGDGEPDTYGFLMNWEETRDLIEEAAYDESIQEVAVSWDREAPQRDKDGDICNTYIEISLQEQHLWYWVDGKLFLDTPIVTGLPTASRMTPTGVYGIFSKGTDVNLIGEMDGEKWDSHVNYWLAVTYSEVGIHDAPWRGTDPANYGGNVYTYNGSHGCINLPYDAEKLLYENTPMGTCVVIY